jgi:hypothetical protein
MRAFARPPLFLGIIYPRAFLTILVLAALVTGAIAGPIRKGAVMEVKPNSIWFEESAKLARWQELKKGDDAVALTSYQEQMLGGREAWQFLKPLKVKILRYDAAINQINVEMRTAGRMKGTTWWLDASAVGQ